MSQNGNCFPSSGVCFHLLENDAKNDAKTTRRPTGGEHGSNPQTPRLTGTLRYAFGNKTKKPKKNKMTRPNSLPLLPSLGCAILFFFVFWVSWFFVFWFVVGFSAIAKQKPNPNKKKKTRKQKRQKKQRKTKKTLLPPWGVQSCFFCCLFFVVWFLGLLFSGSLLVF